MGNSLTAPNNPQNLAYSLKTLLIQVHMYANFMKRQRAKFIGKTKHTS